MTTMDANDNPGPLTLPPVFTAVHVAADAFAAARDLAVAGGEAGTLVVADLDPATTRLELALILEPDRPAAACFAALPVAMLATADALAAIGPPMKPIGFAWPDRLLVDGAEVGQGRLALPQPSPDPCPLWLVVGVELRWRFAEDGDEPGRNPERTALLEEGFGEVTPGEIVEAFARHLLHRVDRWQSDGLDEATGEYRSRLIDPPGRTVRFDPLTFDLLRIGPPPSRERLAERLLPEPAA